MRSWALKVVVVASTLICAGGASAGGRGDYLFNDGHHYLRIEPGVLVIKGNSAKKAVIKRDGALEIGGRPVRLAGKDRRLLRRYDRIAHVVRRQAAAAVKKAGAAAADVVLSVLSGGGAAEQRAEKKMNETVHAAVSPVCRSISNMKQLQDTVAADVAAFAPYAIIKQDYVSDCNS